MKYIWYCNGSFNFDVELKNNAVFLESCPFSGQEKENKDNKVLISTGVGPMSPLNTENPLHVETTGILVAS